MQKKCLAVSIVADLFFAAVVLYYVVSPLYLGSFPIGVVAGICVVLQLMMLIFTIKAKAIKKEKLKAIFTIVVNVISIGAVGYFFVVWSMTI